MKKLEVLSEGAWSTPHRLSLRRSLGLIKRGTAVRLVFQRRQSTSERKQGRTRLTIVVTLSHATTAQSLLWVSHPSLVTVSRKKEKLFRWQHHGPTSFGKFIPALMRAALIEFSLTSKKQNARLTFCERDGCYGIILCMDGIMVPCGMWSSFSAHIFLSLSLAIF